MYLKTVFRAQKIRDLFAYLVCGTHIVDDRVGTIGL